jgi:hypothetical protein
MGRFAGAQAHLRSFAFGNSHGELAMKAWFCEKTTARVTLLKGYLVTTVRENAHVTM